MGFRALLQLRVVDPTRYLIAMIIRVFVDIVPFITILISAIVIIACLEVNTIKSIEDFSYEGTFGELLKKIDWVYNMGYGNWEGQDEYPYHLYILYIFQGLLFAFIMFNLLIAIISSTYENYVENREEIDIQELIEILLDFSSILSPFLTAKKQNERDYLHIFVEADQDEEVLEVVNKLSENVAANS